MRGQICVRKRTDTLDCYSWICLLFGLHGEKQTSCVCAVDRSRAVCVCVCAPLFRKSFMCELAAYFVGKNPKCQIWDLCNGLSCSWEANANRHDIILNWIAVLFNLWWIRLEITQKCLCEGGARCHRRFQLRTPTSANALSNADEGLPQQSAMDAVFRKK